MFFPPDSDVFHTCSCRTVRYAKRVIGTATYKAVIKTGRRPCKLCRPTADYALDELLTKKPALPKNAQSLSAEYDKALERRKTANETRRKLLSEKELSATERSAVLTLTHQGYAFWAKRGYANFHEFGCPRLMSDLAEPRGFAAYNEARAAGYTPCRFCKPNPKHDAVFSIPITSKYRPNEKSGIIKELCAEYGFPCDLSGGHYRVDTPVGKWKIDVSSLPVSLLHINLVVDPFTTKYHVQPRLFLSARDAVDYIKRHDDRLAGQARHRNRLRIRLG